MDTFQTTSTGLLDISSTKLTTYPSNTYIKVLDDVFTPEECADLIALATSSDQKKWEPAKIATHRGDVVDLDYRHSGRILRFDHETAARIFKRLRPHVQELEEIKPDGEWEGIVGTPGWVYGVWKLLGVNERLSFLRYAPGDFFRPHCDGQIVLPDGRKSRVTLQIYLNEGEDLAGGSTRIFDGDGGSLAATEEGRYLDIRPKLGRVLIFQQRGVLHSGEPVTKGLKYALRSDFLFEHTSAV